jgi:hypothetical protein
MTTQTVDSTERDYLGQMQDLVLQVTFRVDCTVFLFGSRAGGV